MKKSETRAVGAIKLRAKPTPATLAIHRGSRAKRHVKFGAVTIAVEEVDPDTRQRNIELGQRALARAAKKLMQPGVSIRAAKGVPLYYMDDTRPGRLMRKLNGKVESGVLQNGEFVVINE